MKRLLIASAVLFIITTAANSSTNLLSVRLVISDAIRTVCESKPPEEVKKVKSCHCSDQCTCGCNSGQRCRCLDYQSAPVIPETNQIVVPMVAPSSPQRSWQSLPFRSFGSSRSC